MSVYDYMRPMNLQNISRNDPMFIPDEVPTWQAATFIDRHGLDAVAAFRLFEDESDIKRAERLRVETSYQPPSSHSFDRIRPGGEKTIQIGVFGSVVNKKGRQSRGALNLSMVARRYERLSGLSLSLEQLRIIDMNWRSRSQPWDDYNL